MDNDEPTPFEEEERKNDPMSMAREMMGSLMNVSGAMTNMTPEEVKINRDMNELLEKRGCACGIAGAILSGNPGMAPTDAAEKAIECVDHIFTYFGEERAVLNKKALDMVAKRDAEIKQQIKKAKGG